MFDLALGIGIPAIVVILCEYYAACHDVSVSMIIHHSVYRARESVPHFRRFWLLPRCFLHSCQSSSGTWTADVDFLGRCGVRWFVK